MYFNNLDFLILGIYCIGIIAVAQYVSRGVSGSVKTSEDYFLAGRSLPWWAIGASLIAANTIGRANWNVRSRLCCWNDCCTYELTAAIALIVMAKYFLPLFLEKKSIPCSSLSSALISALVWFILLLASGIYIY